MARATLRNMVGAVLVVAALLCAANPDLMSQDAKAKLKGRLPAYYGDIVSDAQRQQIYAVQQKYSAQIEALQAQLEVLETKRDKEVEAVLSPDQKEKLKKAQKDASERRKTSAVVKKAIEEAEAAKAAAVRAQKKAK